MRIFLNMGLTEHTGHGVPTIIKKYGKEVFEITNNYIKCRIPFDKSVLESSEKNVGINVGINKTEKAVLGILINNPKKTADEMSAEIGVTKRTVERTLVSLKKKGLIEQIGANKNGIMIIINELKRYKNNLHFIYVEPKSWGPSEEQYKTAMRERKNGSAICLSSVGVGDIVRTQALSSVVMQKNPAVLIAGLSFNEQIVNILVNDINPEKIYLINQGCQRDRWRENAIERIHGSILDEYSHQKDIVTKFLLTEYDKVFEFLVKLYKRYWLTNRIIVSPTGYKMHAISFALMKICCPDIHVEYPTPDSYLFEGYSSDAIESIYELKFERFEEYLADIYRYYTLGG